MTTFETFGWLKMASKNLKSVNQLPSIRWPEECFKTISFFFSGYMVMLTVMVIKIYDTMLLLTNDNGSFRDKAETQWK